MFHRFFSVLFITFSSLALFSHSAIAGLLTFDNGDTLSGELFAVWEDRIAWDSDNIGRIEVKKNRIKELYTSLPLKVQGRKVACYWESMRARVVQFDCGLGKTLRRPLASIKNLVQYEGHEEHLYLYEGKLSASGTWESSSVTREDLSLESTVLLRHTDYRHSVLVKYRSESISTRGSDDQFVNGQAEGRYQFDWFFSPKMFWSTTLAGLQDDWRLIDSRYALGTGIGYQFWERKRTALSIETGPELVSESIQDASSEEGSIEREFTSWTLGMDFRYEFPRSIKFSSGIQALQPFDLTEEWEVKSKSTVSLPIALGISAELTYEYNFDNVPPQGQEQVYSNLRFGVGYQW